LFGCGSKPAEEEKSAPVPSDARIQQSGGTLKPPSRHD
jgi:hypothetical protein